MNCGICGQFVPDSDALRRHRCQETVRKLRLQVDSLERTVTTLEAERDRRRALAPAT